MPQPLSRVNPNAGIVIANAGDYPLDRQPDLARLAMRVVAAWSTLEAFVSHLFVTMLGAHSRPAMAMYTALTSTSAQRDALRAAAATALPAHENELFEVILRFFSSAARERNKIAHWVWGFSPHVTDGVILCDPRTMTQFLIDMHEYDTRCKAEPDNWDVKRAVPAMPKDHLFVYKEQDFTTVISDIERVTSHIAYFTRLLHRDHPVNKGDQLFHQLCNEPDISSELRRRRERQQNTQGVPPQQPPGSGAPSA